MTTDIFLSPVHLRTQVTLNIVDEDDLNETEPEEIHIPDEEDEEDGLLHDINDDQKFKDEDDLIDGDIEEEEDELIEEETGDAEDDYGDGREK